MSNSRQPTQVILDLSPFDEEQEEKAEGMPTNRCYNFDRYSLLRLFLYGAPVLGLLASVLEDADGLAELSDGKIFGIIPLGEGTKQFMAAIVPATYCVVLLSLSKEWTVPGANLTIECLRNRRLPSDWPQLSRRKQWVGMTLCGVYTYAVFADAIATAYFINIMPDIYRFNSSINTAAWEVWAYSAGIVASLATFCSETLDTAKLTWELLNGEFVEKTPQGWQEWLALTLGLPIGLAGSLADSITMYFAVGKQFGIKNYDSQLALFSINGVLNTIPDFIFNGRRAIIEPLEKFLKKISAGFTYKEAAIFMPISAFSLLVAEGFRHLLINMLSDPDIPMPLSLSDNVKSGFGILYFINSFIYCESYLYQAGPFFSTAWQYLASCCSKTPVNERHETELVSPATQSPEEQEEEMSSDESIGRPEGVTRQNEGYNSDDEAPSLNVKKTVYGRFFRDKSAVESLLPKDPKPSSRSWCSIM